MFIYVKPPIEMAAQLLDVESPGLIKVSAQEFHVKLAVLGAEAREVHEALEHRLRVVPKVPYELEAYQYCISGVIASDPILYLAYKLSVSVRGVLGFLRSHVGPFEIKSHGVGVLGRLPKTVVFPKPIASVRWKPDAFYIHAGDGAAIDSVNDLSSAFR